jgi:uncharacterized protein
VPQGCAMVHLTPLPDFARASLDEVLRWIDDDRPPPVERWHPERKGSIDIRITADGRWWHEGGEIRREALVRLFSRIVRHEGGGRHVLVTPAEQLDIVVDDAPFVVVECRVDAKNGVGLFRLNTGEIVAVGEDNPLILRDGPAGRLPYLVVRGQGDAMVLARLSRPVWMELAGMADAAGMVMFDGRAYSLGAVE